MKEFKGTEGAWLVKPGKSSGFIVESDAAPKTRKNIASCGGQRREENARLIAAAPELLDALIEARVWVQGWNAANESEESHKALVMCNLAIAKALGEN